MPSSSSFSCNLCSVSTVSLSLRVSCWHSHNNLGMWKMQFIKGHSKQKYFSFKNVTIFDIRISKYKQQQTNPTFKCPFTTHFLFPLYDKKLPLEQKRQSLKYIHLALKKAAHLDCWHSVSKVVLLGQITLSFAYYYKCFSSGFTSSQVNLFI